MVRVSINQGNWGDAMIIRQAVADQLNLKIIIAETHDLFSEHIITQLIGLSATQQVKDVYLGHINEYHYDQHYHIVQCQVLLR